MATMDKTIHLNFCPLCGTAKESDVYAGKLDNELWPKFYCGTIIRPFEKEINVQGEKCRILQKMRVPGAVGETRKHPGLGKDLL
jgi:hypothetical protein